MRYELLGPLRLVGVDTRTPVNAPKQQALLTTLLIRSDQVVGSEHLGTELWGERPPRRAQAALHVHVSQVRRLLPAGRLATVTGGYTLRIRAGDEVDAHEFRALSERGRAHLRARRYREAVACLERALTLWRTGPVLTLAGGRTVAVFARWLEETRLECLEMLVEARLALGGHQEVVDLLTAVLADHPLHENFHRQLMVALVRAGRWTDALRAYQHTHRLLREELGLEPDRSLRELHHWILRAYRRREVAQAC
ncbi:hypothetical protein GCM10009541_36590 [Micromonospora gifhornensis]|uniref:Pathway-specific SARP activator n=2 Tax=Micromonospora TaxID=1873 RepID=G1C864_MICM1|nr:pathway-specific SARP activator [Micromonospora maris AB-18-032]RUL90221.1 hypothetical protein EG812_26380 [Verrucosispora sp. FIM060022]GIJ19193.1 hypothetical protein Vgi01_58770 [Micromonospora gifhornensis]